jgi:hypothetical protein
MTTAITVQTMKAPFAVLSAGDLDFTLAAGDTAGSTFVGTGRELVVIYNPTGGSTYTVTITSVANDKNRTGTITAYSMAAGDHVAWTGGLTNSPGWKNASTGIITITVSNAAVLIAVLRLPAGYPG